jgi:ubiquinone/menaquinone biosynthesis C-methylase UbiE
VIDMSGKAASKALGALERRGYDVDISERQIEVACSRAATLGLEVDFVQADVFDLSALTDATFDLVYTGGHVAVWVSDLKCYYRQAARILKPDGLLMINEYHPFRRVWGHSRRTLEIGFNCFDRGPHRFETAPDVSARRAQDAEPASQRRRLASWT